MESSMFAISSMKSMEVIDINTGTRLGYIKDFKIDCDNHKVEAIVLPGAQRTGWFSRPEDIEVLWSNIRKIGVDVILVDDENIVKNLE